MLTKSLFMEKYPTVREGTKVFGRDGEELGKASYFGDESFTVQKGLFFPKDFTLRYDDIQEFKDGGIYLLCTQDELNAWRDTGYKGWTEVEDVNLGKVEPIPTETFRDKYTSIPEEDLRVPLMEEDLEVKKTLRESGRVRIRKIVHTEHRHITVPVMSEEIEIEHIKGTEAAPLTTEGKFEDSTIEVPLMEEDVEVGKRAKLKEEVLLHKKQNIEQRDVEGEVRSEEADVERIADEKLRKKAV